MKKGIMIVFVVVSFVSSAMAVNIETVPVGNVGNGGELSGADAGGSGYNRICGAVNYEYNIGKYEVTAGQYTEFLNAVATTDTYGLYNTDMWGGPYECQIQRSGPPGGYFYNVASDWANRPVNYVSWGDAARFANWLHNGQPTGEQDVTTTESGAYSLNGAMNQSELGPVTREASWKWALPTEDEWYKAAYHKNDGVTGNYFDYATGSDTVPSNDLVEPTDPGNNATFSDNGRTIGWPYNRTEIGAHENSESPYGTYDQGGNVIEWTDGIRFSSWWYYRVLRGGGHYSNASRLHASYRHDDEVNTEYGSIGFRVVSEVPGQVTAGDTNLDHVVNDSDYDNLVARFGGPPSVESADFNGDGIVDLEDFAIMRGNYGFGVSAPEPEFGAVIPEPATFTLLALGGLAILRRRRRTRLNR